jgi:hypothetical protein
MIDACPECGDKGGWYANCRAYGWAQQQGGWDAVTRDRVTTNIDSVTWCDTKFVICEKCGARILRSLLGD